MHYNLEGIILLRHLIIPDCIINITLTIRECQADHNFAGSLMFAYLVICFNDGQARCPIKNTNYEMVKNRSEVFL